MAVAGPSNLNSTPAIFNLTIDCFDEIFDYLSLQDLSSFGQTCKSMQKVSGEYFKRNYFANEYCHRRVDGIYGNEICMIVRSKGYQNKMIRVPVNIFTPYISQLTQMPGDIGRLLIFIVKNIDQFSSLIQFNFWCCDLNNRNFEYIKSMLCQVEIINLRRCEPFEGDFYDMFLKYCKNLKRFNVMKCDLACTQNFDGNSVQQNPWLKQHYPKLEHLKLIPEKELQINELNEFFTINPKVKSFSTSAHCLWMNRDQLLNSTIKLNTLEIWMNNIFNPPAYKFKGGVDIHLWELRTRMQAICQIINQLHRQGFYKELKLYLHDDTQQVIDEVASLLGLEMLSIAHFKKEFNHLPLTLVKELSILKGVENMNLEDLARKCIRLKYLNIDAKIVNQILPFIRYSPNLKKIKTFADVTNSFSIDMISLNRERKKLFGARKLIVYVPDNIFLATKWTTNNGDINLSLVELRRIDSCKFFND